MSTVNLKPLPLRFQVCIVDGSYGGEWHNSNNFFYNNAGYDSSGNILYTLDPKLRNGDAIGLSIGWNNGGGHAVTVWGFTYDSAYDRNNGNYYKTIVVSDSDNNVNGTTPASRPNTLDSHTLTWNSTESTYNYDNDGYINCYYWLKMNKDPTTGYALSDTACLREFLEQTDANGVKNGTKINANYSPTDPTTWTGVWWTEVNGVKRITAIGWDSKGLSGSLNLSGCTTLTTLDCSSNPLTTLDVSGGTVLENLYCHYNSALRTVLMSPSAIGITKISLYDGGSNLRWTLKNSSGTTIGTS